MHRRHWTKILSLLPAEDRPPHLRSFLLRSQIRVTEVDSGGDALSHLANQRFDLAAVCLPLPDMSVGHLVTAIQRLQAPVPLLLLAKKHQFEAARVFESETVRVVPLAEGDESLRKIIAESLGIATRLSIRIPIHLEVGVDTGSKYHFCETRNLSRSGMLISSSQPLAIGSTFSFELMLPHSLDPLKGRAEVVRHSDPGLEDTTGFGARFVDLAATEGSRLERLVRAEHRAD